MKRLSSITGSLLAAALVAWAGIASAERAVVPVMKIRVSQPAIGIDSAKIDYKSWKQQAKKRGISLKKMARKLRSEALEKVLPGDLDPDGMVIQSDKHNGAWRFQTLQKKTGVKLKVTVDIEEDYRGLSQEAFANAYVASGKGRFDPALDGKAPVEKMASLPRRAIALKDDKLRSSIDTVFDKLGLAGEMFKDYVEIDVGRRLREDNVFRRLRKEGLLAKGDREVPRKKVFARPIIKSLTAMLRAPEMREFLVARARTPADVPKILARLDK